MFKFWLMSSHFNNSYFWFRFILFYTMYHFNLLYKFLPSLFIRLSKYSNSLFSSSLISHLLIKLSHNFIKIHYVVYKGSRSRLECDFANYIMYTTFSLHKRFKIHTERGDHRNFGKISHKNKISKNVSHRRQQRVSCQQE